MSTLLLLLTVHFVADIVFQSHWVATNKSKSVLALLWHTLIYAWTFFALGYLSDIPFDKVVAFATITFVLHTVQDAVTSRINARLFGKHWHWFFVSLFADHLLHAWQLGLTWRLVTH